ncbi:MAG: N-acetylmuramoyl-L-alanine amidase, partial [Oscillospiraceae bacterium]|nr:N-acetylmuramoyl-L-alanine amidase [Oscillospiraceae bacterium]
MRNSVRSVSEKKLTIIIISIFVAAALLGTVAALAVRFISFPQKGGNESSQISGAESSQIAQQEITSSLVDQTESGIVYESDDGTNFSVPDKLRAVYLKPGQDFILKTTDSEAAVKAQLDNAMQSTAKLGFNSVVIFTNTSQGLIFSDSSLKSLRTDFDVLSYALEAAKKQNLYTYVVYPVLVTEKNNKITKITEFTDKNHKEALQRAEAFSKKYQPSAIIFDDYTVSKSETMEASYQASKSSKSYEDFLREQVTLSVREARNAMRKNNKASQIGFLASGVWANSTTDAKGSKTASNYESYVHGFADTRDFVLNEKFNFVMVENMMPTDSVLNNFQTIAQWWSSVCSQADIAFYNVHASSKLHTSLGEFTSPDQLIRQVSLVEPLKAFGGSVFDSLSILAADKDGSTTLLLKYFDNKLRDNLIFNKLIMSTPTKNNITTYDSTISFSGVTDPNFQTTFNGQIMNVTEKGYFSYDAALKIGTNTFKITHKGKTVSYTVTRKVKLLESVMPTGTVEVDGDTYITISAKGYSGSSISAKIGGTIVKLTEKKAEDVSDEQITSQYVTFEGSFKTPAATQAAQNLGSITFTASWQGYSENITGATIKIFAKPAPPKLETQKAVQITEKFAETFPTDLLNDQSQPNCYPLPAGTIDYVVGNELLYTQDGTTYKYYKLQSGQRVYSKDVTVIGNIEKINNEISSVNVEFDGRFVNLKVENSWNVPFKFIEEPISYKNDSKKYEINGEYKIEKITYRIFHTDKINLDKVVMQDNPMFSKIECIFKKITIDEVEIPVCDIVLTLKTKGGYFGATPSYNENTLNIRLNTSAPIQKAQNAYGYTLKGAVIVLDAGHDKLSPGAPGVTPAYPEYILNEMVRDEAAKILKNLGATVITVDNSVYRTADQRFKYYHASNPHIMICIHHNSSTSSSAKGAIGAYFNSYS